MSAVRQAKYKLQTQFATRRNPPRHNHRPHRPDTRTVPAFICPSNVEIFENLRFFSFRRSLVVNVTAPQHIDPQVGAAAPDTKPLTCWFDFPLFSIAHSNPDHNESRHWLMLTRRVVSTYHEWIISTNTGRYYLRYLERRTSLSLRVAFYVGPPDYTSEECFSSQTLRRKMTCASESGRLYSLVHQQRSGVCMIIAACQ